MGASGKIPLRGKIIRFPPKPEIREYFCLKRHLKEAAGEAEGRLVRP